MKIFKHNNMEFICENNDNIKIFFSTGVNGLNFKKESNVGMKNLQELKNIFGLKDVYYLNQIHSDKFIDVSNVKVQGDIDGDALVLKGEEIAIGVFTADCVPVILYDKKLKVIAAVHSGWKGTINDITRQTCEYMRDKLMCNDIHMIIGPHIGECCYEVSNALVESFTAKYGKSVATNRNISLEECIKIQVKDIVKQENIKSLGLCTFCNKDVELQSYRKDKDKAGRLFSFIFIK